MIFFKFKNFIPDNYVDSIHEIDYQKLYDNGKRLILSDLDNTLISYQEEKPTKELFLWKQKLEDMGFEIVLVSNSLKGRVRTFAEALEVPYVEFAKKPLTGGLKKAIKLAKTPVTRDQVIEIGDQLLTDVYGTKKLGIYTVLVKACDRKTEFTGTKINRFIEKRILKIIKLCYKEKYNSILKKYVSDNYAK